MRDKQRCQQLVYMFLAHLIVSRFRPVQLHVESPVQRCSVLGRNIFSSLYLARHLLAYENFTKLSGVFVSLDQMKPFDRVEHCFLLEVLSAFGFPESFIALLQSLYSNLTSRLLIIGWLLAPFPFTRGVRQGCLLPPALYVLSLDPPLRRLDVMLGDSRLPFTQTRLFLSVSTPTTFACLSEILGALKLP